MPKEIKAPWKPVKLVSRQHKSSNINNGHFIKTKHQFNTKNAKIPQSYTINYKAFGSNTVLISFNCISFKRKSFKELGLHKSSI